MTTLRIAVAQPAMSADARENGPTVRRMMRDAADEGARLVHFPEGMLSGYAVEQIEDWAEVDWAAVRAELGQVAALAEELSLWVVLGSAHPLTPPNRPHNSLYVITDTGVLIDRYDKRICSHTEITRFYSPGFEPVVFEVDGFRFGCAICIEVNFPELFSEYERLGVDCLLFSAYPVDAVFEMKVRAHAAINNYWVSLSVPAQTAHLFPSALVGPDGQALVRAGAEAGLVVGELDRDAPELEGALRYARPWRAVARVGDIYEERRVTDPRSEARTEF
ncbi:carbon-nitrogen hydrolase family protein [Nocardioides koreensis]|uniref:Carbon-nitrogen hydrolase family protein n=1 Tax=Nocardioides koreensis TaxID=433651 RepID=A0ABP5LF74_9ACTN